MNILLIISLVTLTTFSFSQENQNQIFKDSLINVFPIYLFDEREYFEEEFMDRNGYALAQIHGASHLLGKHSLIDKYIYSNKKLKKVEVYYCAEREDIKHGANVYVYYNRKLIVYFLDFTKGHINSVTVCEECKMNPKKLDREKYLIVHTEYSRKKGFLMKFLE